MKISNDADLIYKQGGIMAVSYTHLDVYKRQELEYPIYTRMGAGGGVFILDSSRLQQRWLTVRQRELLMAESIRHPTCFLLY